MKLFILHFYLYIAGLLLTNFFQLRKRNCIKGLCLSLVANTVHFNKYRYKYIFVRWSSSSACRLEKNKMLGFSTGIYKILNYTVHTVFHKFLLIFLCCMESIVKQHLLMPGKPAWFLPITFYIGFLFRKYEKLLPLHCWPLLTQINWQMYCLGPHDCIGRHFSWHCLKEMAKFSISKWTWAHPDHSAFPQVPCCHWLYTCTVQNSTL